jgi:hypothetical protein
VNLPALDTHALGALEIKDFEGKAVKVGSAWEDAPALLVFLRHFG